MSCPICKTHYDSNINAAKNIKTEGLMVYWKDMLNFMEWSDIMVILLLWESLAREVRILDICMLR